MSFCLVQRLRSTLRAFQMFLHWLTFNMRYPIVNNEALLLPRLQVVRGLFLAAIIVQWPIVLF